MNRVLPILTLLFVYSCEDNEEKEVITFVKTFGGNSLDIGSSAQQTADGGYIIGGLTSSFGNGYYDAWLIKTDSEGNEVWNKTFGESGFDGAHSVQQTSDGGYIMTGWTSSFGNGASDVWLIKTDGEGNEEWNQTFGGSYPDDGHFVQQTIDSGYIITGQKRYSFWTRESDVLLIKSDSKGNEEWNYTFGGSGWNEGNSVQQTVDGGYILTGSTSSFEIGNLDICLIKIDSKGNEEWNRIFGKSRSDEGYSVQQTTDGGYIITGSTLSSESRWDVWLIKTDFLGNEVWNKTLGGNAHYHGSSIQQTTDGGYIITGNISPSEDDYYQEVWLIKTDSQGNEEWNKTFGGSDDHKGNSVRQTTDGGYIITGYTLTFDNGGKDILLIKTDSEGNTVPYK